MPSRSTLWLAAIVIIVAAAVAHADVDELPAPLVEPAFSASIGLEVTFTPIPPSSFDVGSELELALYVDDFTFGSETRFALSGFQSQRFEAILALGAVSLSDWVLFDPLFRWNQFAVRARFFGIDAGTDLILANIGSTQTPAYSMAGVLLFEASPVCGLSVLSLTGFGAVDLLALKGGIDAPFSHRLLHLFDYLDLLCAEAPDLTVTVVPDFYFEEQVVRLELDLMGLLMSSTTWFDWMGFARETLEVGFAFRDPNLAFLMAITFDGMFAIEAMDFILDVYIAPVSFTSRTAFLAPPAPTPVPIAFAGQQFGLSVEAIGILFTFETDFDGSFLFERQLIALEMEIPPVVFTSLTTFDIGGFAGQCLRAAVRFSGVLLYSGVTFDLSGITEASFGFELTF
ncbi:MAG: hypothetical protein JSW65_04640 [Candidatus Bipolaricaulota bacterium]|nr:MAG: hypothetical protein JSW65_04640 [Candidatus Bipolaricaulota bacterium]